MPPQDIKAIETRNNRLDTLKRHNEALEGELTRLLARLELPVRVQASLASTPFTPATCARLSTCFLMKRAEERRVYQQNSARWYACSNRQSATPFTPATCASLVSQKKRITDQ